MKDLEDGVKEDEKMKEQEREQLRILEETIQSHENDLSQITPEYNEKKTTEEECKLR